MKGRTVATFAFLMGLSTDNKIGSEKKPYYVGLDAVRIAAALMVGAFHLTFENRATSHMVFFGFAGVQIFFVISGIVIANSANNVTAMHFLKHRFLRLYPAAWICSVLGAVSLIVGHEATRVISHEFIKSVSLFVKGPWLGSAYWTIPIEISFYAVVGLMICVRAFNRLEMFASALTMVSFAYVMAIASSWFRFGSGGWADVDYGVGNLLLVRYGVFFGVGLFFWLSQQGLLTWLGRVVLLFGLAGAVVEIFARAAEVCNEFAVPMDRIRLFEVTGGVFASACYVIFFASRYPMSGRGTISRTLRALGLASYPFYLLHESIGLPLVARLEKLNVMPLWCAVAITVGVVLALSLVVSSYLEVKVRAAARQLLDLVEAAWVRPVPMFRFLYRHGGAAGSL